jgi:hypothetical protein
MLFGYVRDHESSFHKATGKIIFSCFIFVFNILYSHSGGGVQTGSTSGISATNWPIVPALGDCEDG